MYSWVHTYVYVNKFLSTYIWLCTRYAVGGGWVGERRRHVVPLLSSLPHGEGEPWTLSPRCLHAKHMQKNVKVTCWYLDHPLWIALPILLRLMSHCYCLISQHPPHSAKKGKKFHMADILKIKVNWKKSVFRIILHSKGARKQALSHATDGRALNWYSLSGRQFGNKWHGL